MKTVKLNILLICFFSFSANAATRFVTSTGAGLLNGTNWANAFPGTSLQAAINASIAGDEVWVATGTYFTTNTANRNIYFNMLNGVAIYGSFNGTETTLSQRSFSCGFTSLLSAEIGVPGNADNSYHVINNSSLNNTAILDGFTISGANANFDLLGNDNRSLGGGMLNNAANSGTCSPTIRNCLFSNNTALFGGGIFNHGQNGGNANPVITNCIFAFNTATSGGGGIDNFGYNGNASPVITNSIFYNNTAASRAGAMYCWGAGNGNASPIVLNSVFINNSSVDGGGIVSDRTNFVSGNSGTANPTIRNCIFWGNIVSGVGPQFFLLGNASLTATYSCIDMSNQNGPHIIAGPGTGNIVLSPTFINIANAAGVDNCWLTTDDGLQLQNTSPCINVGNNVGVSTFDIIGNNRIITGTVDMGAYELNGIVLPVNLIRFDGETAKLSNILHWSTASEYSNHSFEIERSTNGLQFEKIATVLGTGESINKKNYYFADYKIFEPQYFYRLKLIDRDGHFSFGPIILLKNNLYKNELIVFPNPVINVSTVFWGNKLLMNETFLLIGSNGQLIRKIIFNGKFGYIDLTKEAAGMYFLINRKLGIQEKMYKVGN